MKRKGVNDICTKRDEKKVDILKFVRVNSVMVGEQNFANPRRKFTTNNCMDIKTFSGSGTI